MTAAGTTAGAVDFTGRIKPRLVWLILAVIVIAFALLTTAFRSVVIATKAAILNLLSIGAAYGVIVAIFEWGWAKSLIGLHTTLPIPAYVPMLVFAIVFGLSMDYEVFLLSRVHEAWVATNDPIRAVAIGIGGTAQVITTAALTPGGCRTGWSRSCPTCNLRAAWRPRALRSQAVRYRQFPARAAQGAVLVRSVCVMEWAGPGGRPRARRTAAMAAAGVLVAAGALLTACSSGSSGTPQAVAASYLSDWASRDWSAMRALVAGPPADFTAANAAALTDLTVTHASYTAGRMIISGSSADETVAQRLRLAGISAGITITSVLKLVDSSGRWLVSWSPATIAPQLRPGDQLSLQVNWPPRAQILGTGGAPLTAQVPMVTVGVEGQLIKNAKAVSAALVSAGAPQQAVTSALDGAKAEPTWFEPVYTISWARYQQLKPTIYPIPGTVFQTIYERAPITPGLGYVVGSVGPITAQQLQQLGPPYNASDVVGQTGLEGAYQRQLAGQPGVTITATTANGAPVAAVATVKPRPGAPVQTTIDPQVQRDVESALASVHKQAALIAVDAQTGQVLASDTVPGTSGFNLALDGAFPPGSSFKIITSTALIEHGLTPSSPASCPQQLVVDGEVFHNSEGTAPISDLLYAFAESCNTAFIGLATHHLTAAEFPSTAAQYRIGTTPQLGLPAFGGSVPEPTDEADLAATTIGQGRVLMSPLAMAMVAAAVDTGQVRAPVLVSGAPDAKVAPVSLPSAVVSYLHTMMAQVVATGTASGKGLPPGTYAKTGTAQYGSGNPLPQDAWLVGFNGNIAFAMVTVNGGEGGPTDGPIVAKFLDLVRQSGG